MSRARKRDWDLKRKPSGVYFVEYYVTEETDGEIAYKRRRDSCDTRDYKEARTRAQQIVNGSWRAPSAREKADHRSIKRPNLAGQITVAQLFDRCRETIWSNGKIKANATAISNARILGRIIGNELITDMTYSRLEDLKKQLEETVCRTGKPYMPGTVDRKMNAIGAALTQATKEKDAEGNHWLLGKPAMPTVVVNNICDRTISRSEEAAIFAACAARAKKYPTRDWRRFGYFLRFLLDTACRMSEALNLTVSQIEEGSDYDEETAQLIEAIYAELPRYSTKNNLPRQLPLSDEIVEALPYLKMNALEGRIFPWDAVWYHWNLIRQDVKKMGHDIGDVKIHTFRHTCLTRLAKSQKVRLEDISDFAGHSSIQITKERYVHLLRSSKVRTVGIINQMKSVKRKAI